MRTYGVALVWLVWLVWVAGCSHEVDDTPTHTDDASGDSDAAGDTDTVIEDTGTPPLELCINEFMPRNVTSLEDEAGAYPDWIELHNPGDKDVNLGGWSLTDDPDDVHQHPLSGELVVLSGAYLLLYADGQPELGPQHLGFALSVDGESLGLFRDDERGQLVEYGALDSDVAASRITDCCEGECWEFVFGGTPGETNINAGDPL